MLSSRYNGVVYRSYVRGGCKPVSVGQAAVGCDSAMLLCLNTDVNVMARNVYSKEGYVDLEVEG